ncbi:HIT family protein [Spongiibacter sp. KMU-158]|uniref:HIT family protein n=1 Tax=Spongiibacter pelagi TaxID=2760804 RepID=A0A927GWP6_9GAMM|nr:HIT family protein [Spongiibacter pelagi]MBD2859157.1 HIT family protein [Spongiibacter pelagi]
MSSVFSMIIKRELPGHFVYEDDLAIGIMTIAPIVPGHVLVIPKEEIDHWDDLPAELMAHLFAVSKTIAKAQKQVYQSERVSLQIVGLEVPHTHLHLVPINTLSDADFSGASMAEQSALAAEAEKIRQALAG